VTLESIVKSAEGTGMKKNSVLQAPSHLYGKYPLCVIILKPFFRKYGGHKVELCGSFSQWQIRKPMHKEDENE